MDSSSLSHEQCEKILTHTGPLVTYLANMHGRMNQRLFPQDDPLLILTVKAHRALMDLHTHVRTLPNQSHVQPIRTPSPPDSPHGAT